MKRIQVYMPRVEILLGDCPQLNIRLFTFEYKFIKSCIAIEYNAMLQNKWHNLEFIFFKWFISFVISFKKNDRFFNICTGKQ